jgi:hypothetical protein
VASLGIFAIVFFQWKSFLEFVFIATEKSVTVSTKPSQLLRRSNQDDSVCQVWMMESIMHPKTLGMFTGVARKAGEGLLEPDVVIPIVDANRNEYRYLQRNCEVQEFEGFSRCLCTHSRSYSLLSKLTHPRSPLHDFTLLRASKLGSQYLDIGKHLVLETPFMNDMIVPGLEALFIGANMTCSDEMANVRAAVQDWMVVEEGVHRSAHPTAGSFSYQRNVGYAAQYDLVAGQELFLPCAYQATPEQGSIGRGSVVRSIASLTEDGNMGAMCIDNLFVAPSTLEGVGRGAFAKDYVEEGQLITSTPVIQFDRSQTEIVEQRQGPVFAHRHGIRYRDTVKGRQLLLNYAFGHPDSNVLLLPFGPGVSFINHQAGKKANAEIQWLTRDAKLLETSAHAVVDRTAQRGLMLNFVALRNIRAGEEIFLDYGDLWSKAWKKHVFQWRSMDGDKDYVSAAEYQRLHYRELFRTEAEQVSNPYPDNLRTVCHVLTGQNTTGISRQRCLRPCDIKERSGTSALDAEYIAVVYPTGSAMEPLYCKGLSVSGLRLTGVPGNDIELIDKPYTTDTYLPSAFRHEIGVPDDLYPAKWMKADPRPMGDLRASPLRLGQVEPFRWNDTGAIALPNAFRVGLPPKLRETLLEFATKMGVTNFMHSLTAGGNAIPAGMQAHEQLWAGSEWHLMRPPADWASNLLWLSPRDKLAHESFLEALGAGGFDEVLKGIGESLGFDGLAAFHITFIGVSHASRGFLHKDHSDSNGKAFNVIIPLILANETGPELDIVEHYNGGLDRARAGRYRYEYDVGSMLGDDAFHATSAVDYRTTKEFRLAATIYVADINNANVDAIMNVSTVPHAPV